MIGKLFSRKFVHLGPKAAWAAEQLDTEVGARALLDKLQQQLGVCAVQHSPRAVLLKRQIELIKERLLQFQIEGSDARAREFAARSLRDAETNLKEAQAAAEKTRKSRAAGGDVAALQKRLDAAEAKVASDRAEADARVATARKALNDATIAGVGEAEAVATLQHAYADARSLQDGGVAALQLEALRDALRTAEQKVKAEEDDVQVAERQLNHATLEIAKVRADIATKALIDALLELHVAAQSGAKGIAHGYMHEQLAVSDRNRVVMGHAIVNEVLGTISAERIGWLSSALRPLSLAIFSEDAMALADRLEEAPAAVPLRAASAAG